MNAFDYVVIAVYMSGMLAMGFAFRKQAGRHDYFLGGRSMGWLPLALSVMATQLSAISFISAPAFVGLREGGGMIWLSYELAVPLAMLFLMGFVAPALHRSGVVSVYDFLERRFDRSSRILLSLVFQVSRSFATAIMIYALSIILRGAMGLNDWQSILLIGVSTVVYSLQGGMKAVVYGDAIQMVIIVLGTLACIFFGLEALGGWNVLMEQVDPARLEAVRFDSFGFDGEGFGFWPMLFGGLVLYSSYYGCDQTEAQRSLAARDENQLRTILLVNGAARFPITLLYCTAGLVIGALATGTPEFLAQIPAGKPDWMIPVFIVEYLPTGIRGLLVVAIMAAAMSSLSSAINSLSAVSVEDFARLSGKDLSIDQYMTLAKVMAVVWGVITLGLSFMAGQIAPTVIEAINLIGSIFYGPIIALFVMAIGLKAMSTAGANVGLLTGVATNLAIKFLAPNIFWFWYNVTGFLAAIAAAFAAHIILRAMAAPMPDGHDHENVSIITRREAVILPGVFVVIIAVSVWLTGFAQP